jgi:hypothetical protein
MRKAIRAKFDQHPNLKQLLMSTGNAILMENSPYDDYWGIGPHGDGSNWLGHLLMELREEYKNIQ